MLNSRGRRMHQSLLSPGTEDFTHLHKSECPAQGLMGAVVRGFQMTGA